MNTYSYLLDRELLSLAKQDDKAALEELYVRFWCLFYSYASILPMKMRQVFELSRHSFLNLHPGGPPYHQMKNYKAV
jgi:hypothetical protein